MKKQIIPFLLFLLFAVNIQAQVTLINKDPRGGTHKIVISTTRTYLYDKANQGTKLWLYWKQVPKKDADCKDYGHCYHMTVKSSDHLANRTFYIKYSKPFKEPRYENPIFTGVMKSTFVYKDVRPTKTITENFTEIKKYHYEKPTLYTDSFIAYNFV